MGKLTTYICTICGEKLSALSLEELPETTSNCDHNWVLYRGEIKDLEDIGGDLDANPDEIFEEIKKEAFVYEAMPIKEIKDRLSNRVGIDYFTELNKDYEKIYNEIVVDSGLNLTLPQFRSLMEDISLYGDEQHQFLKLLNSKIIQKYSNLAIGKLGIGVSILIEKLSENLIERASNLTEDEIGDNNNKLIQLGSKSLREYLGILKELKEFEIPEVDRKLKNIKESSEKKEDNIKLSGADIQKLLDQLNNKD